MSSSSVDHRSSVIAAALLGTPLVKSFNEVIQLRQCGFYWDGVKWYKKPLETVERCHGSEIKEGVVLIMLLKLRRGEKPSSLAHGWHKGKVSKGPRKGVQGLRREVEWVI